MQRFILMSILLLPILSQGQLLPSSDDSKAVDKQTDLLGQGTLNLSINGFGSYAGYRGANFRLTPRISYFLKDGWSLSLEGRHEQSAGSSSNIGSARYTGIGLSTRYYFVRDRRLALFLQGGATVGNTRFMAAFRDPSGVILPLRYVSTFTLQTNAGLGVHYRLSRRWALEGNVEGAWTDRHAFRNHLYRTQGNIGIVFKLK
jgi:hypothetical protein